MFGYFVEVVDFAFRVTASFKNVIDKRRETVCFLYDYIRIWF